MRDRIMLFALNHDKLLTFLFIGFFVGIGFIFDKGASAAYIQPINTSPGTVPTTGASGILNTGITWVCYRLAPATTLLGTVKGLYDIKFHKPQAAGKAFITAAAGVGVMIAPTIVNAIITIIQNNQS